VADFLDEKRREIAARLRRLKPQVDEHNRLEAAMSALEQAGGSAIAGIEPRLRGRGRPPGPVFNASGAKARGASSKAARRKAGPTVSKGRPGPRKGSGRRAAEALSFIRGQPGITIAELAAKMKIKRNYLYRVLPGLEQEGRVRKDGRGWHPAP
jgi:hypothetical protein